MKKNRRNRSILFAILSLLLIFALLSFAGIRDCFHECSGENCLFCLALRQTRLCFGILALVVWRGFFGILSLNGRLCGSYTERRSVFTPVLLKDVLLN